MKTEVKRKRLYAASQKRHRRHVILLMSILLIYAFFFTSNFTLPQPISDATAMDVALRYSPDRSVTIYDAKYDKEARMLELVLTFDNYAYDNVNDYYFFLNATGRHRYEGLKVDTVIHDSLITVLRVSGLKPFHEARLIFAPKVSENLEEIPDSLVGALTFNKGNLKYERIDESLTRDDYLTYRFQSVVKTSKEALAAAHKNLEQLTAKQEALKAENEDLTENMKYFTSDEKQAAKAKMKANEKNRTELNLSIAEAEERIKVLQEKYDEANRMLHKNFDETETEETEDEDTEDASHDAG